ncbi:hypothetical protein [Amycolatopsis sp. WQ 127309]|uniref:hypothetical protein n=1 Tax=Amycolatopsis sp. WQ 127309 TaxID=2932773 RepID=UPI001FF6BF1D|nr:hypothetical protein [Amycolatopsis sp. WQ 127309]UOZ09387.1 hypothetical protein MUY22_14390 [Amycolatopsis sp. WQ 127309]
MVSPEFDDQGIKPLVHGIPELPKAAQTKALARSIKRNGIKAHDGTVVAEFDDASADLLAYPWVFPGQIAGQLQAPQSVSVQAGTLYFVTGLALVTRMMAAYHNSRARSKLAIPPADSDGHVPMPWMVRDVQPDPEREHQLLITAQNLDALLSAAHNTATHVEALQKQLKEALAREGVEEQVLLTPARFRLINGTLTSDSVWIGSDGGSRITIEQGFLADAVDYILKHKDEQFSPKRRAGLERLGVYLRGRVAGLLVRDAVAERDLRDELEDLRDEPAGHLIANRLYAAQRALVAPARALVAFRPHGGTVLDATQQLIGNAHKRGPKQWDTAATAVDTRDEVLRKLDNDGELAEREKYLLGPAFEEAYRRFGVPSNPDYRAAELVRFFHDQHPSSELARKATREVLRFSKLMPTQRAKVISGAILEQVHEADARRRQLIESALDELLAHPPFWGAPVRWPNRDPEVSDLVAEAKKEQDGEEGDQGPATIELTVKGGIALAILGPLQRIYGDDDATRRNYNVLDRMATDPLGLELLGEGIQALRDGRDQIVKRDPDSHKPVWDGKTAKAMDSANLRDLFPSSDKQAKKKQNSESDLLKSIVKHLTKGVSTDLDSLEELPKVQQQGVTPADELTEAIELLSDQRDRLGHLKRKHADYFREQAPEPMPEPSVPGDEDGDGADGLTW